jgi:opacity protein-like surface antigen
MRTSLGLRAHCCKKGGLRLLFSSATLRRYTDDVDSPAGHHIIANKNRAIVTIIIAKTIAKSASKRMARRRRRSPLRTTAPFYANVNCLASIRGRLGYAWGPGMIYVTGGGAWASVDFNAGGPANDFVFSSTSTKSGWTIGAGYEWLINPNWSVLYYKFTGGTSATVNAGGVAPARTFTTHSVGNFDVNVVRLGLNYKLDWWR